MSYYLVHADPRTDRMTELHDRLTDGEFEPMRPFGRALTVALRGARLDNETQYLTNRTHLTASEA